MKIRLISALLAWTALAPAWAVSPGEDPQAWLEDDGESRALAVNEGELEFLTTPPQEQVLHSTQHFRITRQSLDEGWVGLRQCHEHIDAVQKAQVVYQYRDMRKLRILETTGIARAWVEGQSVQLLDVGADARLCVSAEVNIMQAVDGGFVLRSGPYHRRFLDGYYPLHLTLEVGYSGDLLRLDNVSPPRREGFEYQSTPGKVTVDTWFVGRLFVEMRFVPHAQPAP